MGKRVITQADIQAAARAGNRTILAPPGECIITPTALDEAENLGITICGEAAGLNVSGGQAGEAVSASSQPNQADSAQTEQVVSQVCSLMKEKLPSSVDAGELELLVRQAVSARLMAASAPAQQGLDPAVSRVGGVCLVDAGKFLEGGTGSIPVSEKVMVADALRCGDDARMGGCYMAWERASFNRTVECPEIGIVIEGELHLTVGGTTLIGKPGDMLYLPKGAEVVYSTPTKVRLACVDCLR